MSKKQWIIRLLGGLTFVALLIVLFSFVGSRRDHQLLKEIQISVLEEPDVRFIADADILQLLKDKQLIVQGLSLEAVDLNKIEIELLNHPAVKRAEAYSSQDGHLYVKVEQRKPLFRVIDARGNNYYIDEDGEYMPLQSSYTCRVPVATGLIHDNLSIRGMKISDITTSDSLANVAVLDDLYEWMQQIRKDAFLTALTEQLNVQEDGTIELIPKTGPESIILGSTLMAEDKLKRLKTFYTKALPEVGWNAYQTINLRYNNQIVCTPKTL
ncbi:MAG: cell division protein FtsQ/DivIB [Bacteroidia bacterium]|jgi:cell division protein FtsQ